MARRNLIDTMYDVIMLPFEKTLLRTYREKFISRAYGEVLEIGAGTGANLPFYNMNNIQHVTMTSYESSEKLIEKIKEKKWDAQISYKICDVMNLPFKDNVFDTVVFTLVFCTVSDVEKGLKEIRRVLKAEGRIVFIEHVQPNNQFQGKLTNILTPAWKQIAGGCHLDRRTRENIEDAGFRVVEIDSNGNGLFIAGIAEKSD